MSRFVFFMVFLMIMPLSLEAKAENILEKMLAQELRSGFSGLDDSFEELNGEYISFFDGYSLEAYKSGDSYTLKATSETEDITASKKEFSKLAYLVKRYIRKNGGKTDWSNSDPAFSNRTKIGSYPNEYCTSFYRGEDIYVHKINNVQVSVFWTGGWGRASCDNVNRAQGVLTDTALFGSPAQITLTFTFN